MGLSIPDKDWYGFNQRNQTKSSDSSVRALVNAGRKKNFQRVKRWRNLIYNIYFYEPIIGFFLLYFISKYEITVTTTFKMFNFYDLKSLKTMETLHVKVFLTFILISKLKRI